MPQVKVFVPTGQLGSGGVRADEIEAAIALGMEVIALDAGSTDSGAAYLATGRSKNDPSAVKMDLELLMAAQARTGVPILIGTAGQAGGDGNVDVTVALVREVAREQGYAPKIAVLRSEQDKTVLKAKNADGKITGLAPLGALADETIDACDHIVALMGPEPFISALKQGAEIIVGGRSSDAAVIAAYPLWKGVSPAAAWHAGKIAECGALCSVKVQPSSACFATFDDEGFVLEPLVDANRCTVDSVSEHMLYETSNPYRLLEPGGMLDVSAAVYTQLDERRVRVTGSVWRPGQYTMKLEGAASGRFQTMMIVGIADPAVLSNLDLFHDKMASVMDGRVKRVLGLTADKFDISLRIYGWNALSGRPVPKDEPPPREVGVLCVITAETQEMANRIAKMCNAPFFHLPIHDGIELPSYGFPFTPSSSERGPVYEFKLNHIVAIDDPLELVRLEWESIANIRSETLADAQA